ncbi:MAG: AAA family ATPase [Roseivirga sp.]|nr:AAA family ATPase [Roseivirga sp.]
MSFELSALAQITADYINTTDRHIFLTGKAGTGKTTFLKHIVAHTHKKTVVAAPTGIAAINAEGVTLHSLLQLPFGAFIPERIQPPDINAQITTLFNLFTNLRFNASKRNLIREIELLIIDEVSMLRSDLLDCIDHMLRFLRRRKNEPFGGLQVLFIGDLLQLPPVVKDTEWQVLSQYYKSSYFFEARALKDNPPIHVELQKVYRQSDQNFIGLLNRFRENRQTGDDISLLNGRYQADHQKLSEQGYIHLTTHNRKADDINSQRLKALSTPIVSFSANIEGDYPEHVFPTAQKMELKEGAQVMFIKNDLSEDKLFFNGRIGHINELSRNKILVTFEDGNIVEVPLHKWENKRYSLNKETNEIEEKILGSFEQYPLKLAWAVTVHKSQGLTFEKAILDLSGAFAQGQVYVALSRLTSMEGLVLSSKIPSSGFDLSENMKAFVASKASEEELTQKLDADRKAYLTRLTSSTFDLSELITSLRVHEHSFNKQENRSLKQRYHQWTKDLLAEVLPIKEVSDGFIRQIQKITHTDSDYLPLLTERVAKATGYFTPLLEKLSKDLTNHELNLKDKSKLKTYRKELKELEQTAFNKSEALRKVNLLLQFAAESKVLTKQDLHPEDRVTTRLIKKKSSRKKQAGDKIPTAEVSYKLYKEGKSIEEIAKERTLVTGTIEGHLSQYIQRGELDPYEIVDKQKLDNIMTLIGPETQGMNEIKAKLGSEYTYGDVKIALAYYKFQNPKE